MLATKPGEEQDVFAFVARIAFELAAPIAGGVLPGEQPFAGLRGGIAESGRKVRRRSIRGVRGRVSKMRPWNGPLVAGIHGVTVCRRVANRRPRSAAELCLYANGKAGARAKRGRVFGFRFSVFRLKI